MVWVIVSEGAWIFNTPKRKVQSLLQYCELILTSRLGSDRYKTKTVYETLNPRWLEQFDMYLYEDQGQDLDITVWDKDQRSKDDFMGR